MNLSSNIYDIHQIHEFLLTLMTWWFQHTYLFKNEDISLLHRNPSNYVPKMRNYYYYLYTLQERALSFIYRTLESDYKSLLNLARRSSLYMDSLRTIVTEVYKAINGMSPAFLQDLFVIKANVHDLRDNSKMKLYKFKTMTYGKHSIKYIADILWNSINVDIKIQTM